MYTLKSIARRGTSLSAAVALLVAAVAPVALPAMSAYADSLNPLTKRSLTLSSSSPGWSFTDGSGNSTYAPPNSGANGHKTGNTFSFDVSTDSTSGGTNQPIKAMTFQYCTTSAGNCTAPGNDGWTGTAPSMVRGSDGTSTSDLNVALSAPAEVGASDFSTVVATSGGNAGNVIEVPQGQDSFAGHNTVAGNYVVYYNNAGTWTQSAGWTMQVTNQETGTVGAGTATGKNNYIILSNTTGLGIPSGTQVKVVFFGTDSNYIVNPGAGAFFVKINTYNAFTSGSPDTVSATDIIDGGVTVANVMNQSIQITTKVLETMQFSVGTVDPDGLTSDGTTGSQLHAANGNTSHGPCDPVLTGMTPASPQNVLALGDQNAESSLSTAATYSTHSYWRLSSNSSAGATVYYSGSTLSNTEGDQIRPIGATAAAPLRGSPQFGLAIANGTIAANAPGDGTAGHNYAVDYSSIENDPTKGPFENGADNGANTISSTFTTDMTAGAYTYHNPQLYPLVPATNYQYGAGIINGASGTYTGYGTPNTQFAFDPTSQTIPTALATENAQVVDCVTAKMRYIANIAATTPAGIYTTKVNYIAAPQY